MDKPEQSPLHLLDDTPVRISHKLDSMSKAYTDQNSVIESRLERNGSSNYLAGNVTDSKP